MEYWDIYDENKQPTGRTMHKNDTPGETQPCNPGISKMKLNPRPPAHCPHTTGV